MRIDKIVRDIVMEWLKAYQEGKKFSILEALGYGKSLSYLMLEARLGNETALKLIKEYWKIRSDINKLSRNKLPTSCSLYEWRLLKRWTSLDYSYALSKIGISPENFPQYLSNTDPNWLARGKSALDLDDVSDECFISYLKFIHPF